MIQKLGSFCLMGLILVSGCSLYKDPKVPPLPTPSYFKQSVPVKNKNLSYCWWENFKDPKLTRLVNLALQNNYNYQATLKNIDIAKTYVTQYQSGLFPQVDLLFNASRNKFSENSFINNTGALNVTGIQGGGLSTGLAMTDSSKPFNAFQLEVSVSYELDVWNQIRNQVKQARMDVVVSNANAQVIQLTLMTDVVNTYFQINTLNANLINLKKQQSIAQENLNLLQGQYDSGLIDVSLLIDLKNTLETIKNNLALAKKQREGLLNTLAYLVGEYPETFNCPVNNPLRSFNFSVLIPPGLPSQMLTNRPDIQGAYFQILSYGYLEKQNLASFLPSFILTANDGFSSAHLSNLFSSGSNFWNFGIAIAQPIFDAGMRMSIYKRSKLQYRQAVLNYRDVVIKAFQEVNTALSAYKNDQNVLRGFERQLVNEQEKLDLARAQYRSGVGDYSAYLNAQLAFLKIQYDLMNQRLTVVQDVIQIYKSLGMGLSCCGPSS